MQEDSDEKAGPNSPISKLPFDILSEIFKLCSMEMRLSPLVLAPVCRQWRETILMTPVAWSRIFPQNAAKFILPPEYISMFLERSKPCLLHVRIPWARRDCDCAGYRQISTARCDCANVETMLKHSDRIQCLSITQDWIEELNKREYPNLKRLSFKKYDFNNQLPRISLDMSLFRNLMSLKLGHPWQADSAIDFSNGPKLKDLYLSIDPDDLWVSLVVTCSSSLESLWLYGNFGEARTRRWNINCPRLLRILIEEGDSRGTKGTRVLELVCPRLIAYEYYSKDEIIEVAPSGGVERITLLRLNTVMPLSPYKLLETLQLDSQYNWLGLILSQLEGDSHLCPALKSIEVCDRPDGDYELASHERMTNRNLAAGSNIKLIFVEMWLRQTPAHFYKCTKGMPCRIAYGNSWPVQEKYRF